MLKEVSFESRGESPADDQRIERSNEPAIDSSEKQSIDYLSLSRLTSSLTDDMTSVSFFTEGSIRLDAVLKAIQFPTGIADLHT